MPLNKETGRFQMPNKAALWIHSLTHPEKPIILDRPIEIPLEQPAEEIVTTRQLVETLRIPTVQELIGLARAEIKVFFGRDDIAVPEPPQLLMDTLKRMHDLGMYNFEALYLPQVSIENLGEHPISDIKSLDGNVIYTVGKQLTGNWALFDTTPRQQYADRRKNAYDNDPLPDLLIKVPRNRLLKARPDWLEKDEKDPGDPLIGTSRFGLSTAEQDEVLHELAEKLGLKDDMIRRPNLAEFVYAGNIRYSYLGEVNTLEFMQDEFPKIADDKKTVVKFNVTSGYFGDDIPASLSSLSDHPRDEEEQDDPKLPHTTVNPFLPGGHGLSHAQYIVKDDDARGDAIGFRPIIIFN